MKERHWKVIKIIDDFNIVINAGIEDGLEVTDELEIFAEGELLKDPDTEEVLGRLDLIKAKIRIKNLFDKFSICTNNEEEISLKGSINMLSKPTKAVPRKLNVEQEDITGYGLSYTKAIKIGDLVRKSL